MPLTSGARRRIVIGCAVAALSTVDRGPAEAGRYGSAQQDHPQQVAVNGKSYNWPTRPVVVVLIDGGDPAYVNAALASGLLPHFQKFMHDGFVSVALGAMPSFTNPNNVSVMTGVSPSVHGISGDFFLNPATGQETLMDQPEFVRADSILAQFSGPGARVAAVTAKNELAKIFSRPLNDRYAAIALSRQLRNFDAFEFALNGLQ